MIITALIVFLIAAKVAVPNALAQEEQATKYKLVPLPPQSKPGSSGIAFNLGIIHKIEMDSIDWLIFSDTAFINLHVASFGLNPDGELIILSDLGFRYSVIYTDTALINNYFLSISKKVNPDSVVLVVEERPLFEKEENGEIQAGPCSFITPKMRKMGFVKWIAANNRPSEEKPRSDCYSFMDRYFESNYEYWPEYKENNLDNFGLPYYSIKQKGEIPDSALQKFIPCLTLIKGDRLFEENLKKIRDEVARQGYTPIIIAGRIHIDAIGERCVVQVKDYQNYRGLAYDLYWIRLENYLLERYGEH